MKVQNNEKWIRNVVQLYITQRDKITDSMVSGDTLVSCYWDSVLFLVIKDRPYDTVGLLFEICQDKREA